MALKFTNRCVWTPVSSGAGDFVVNTAVTGYDVPADAVPAIVDGAKYNYFAQSDDLTQWEFGSGPYDAGTATLTRMVENNSSGTTSPIVFSAAPKVYMGGPLAKNMNRASNLILEATSYELTGDIDVSGDDVVLYIGLGENDITSLNASDCPALQQLYCDTNSEMASLDVTGCTALTYLDCSGSALMSLDVTSCAALESLYCNDSFQLATLDVTNLAALETLACENGVLTALDVSGCASLAELTCYSNPIAGALDVSGLVSLNLVFCFSCQLTSLDASGASSMGNLDCNSNPALATLDLTGCAVLQELNCSDCALTALNVLDCVALSTIYANNNVAVDAVDITGLVNLTAVHLSGCALTEASVDAILVELDTNGLEGGSVDLSGGTSSPPSVTGLAAKVSLEGKSWTVVVN